MQYGICYSSKLRCALNPSGQAQRLDLAHQTGEEKQEGNTERGESSRRPRSRGLWQDSE